MRISIGECNKYRINFALPGRPSSALRHSPRSRILWAPPPLEYLPELIKKKADMDGRARGKGQLGWVRAGLGVVDPNQP